MVIRLRLWLRRAAALAVFTPLAAPAAGCRDVLELESANPVVECIHASDCAGTLVCVDNQCVEQCLFDKDCMTPENPVGLVCRSNLCVPPSDGGESEDASCGDTTSSVENCGSCGHVCSGMHLSWTCADSQCVSNGCEMGWEDCNGESADGCETEGEDASVCNACPEPCTSNICDYLGVCAPGACESGACRAPSVPGLLSKNGPLSLGVLPNNLLAYQVHVSPGSLTSFGIITDSEFGPDGGSIEARALLGLYRDVGGQPHDLVATANDGGTLPLATGRSQIFPVTPPVALTETLYWIVVVADQSIQLSATPGQVTYQHSQYLPDAGGLPPLPPTAPIPDITCSPPSSDFNCNTEPALYITTTP